MMGTGINIGPFSRSKKNRVIQLGLGKKSTDYFDLLMKWLKDNFLSANLMQFGAI